MQYIDTFGPDVYSGAGGWRFARRSFTVCHVHGKGGKSRSLFVCKMAYEPYPKLNVLQNQACIITIIAMHSRPGGVISVRLDKKWTTEKNVNNKTTTGDHSRRTVPWKRHQFHYHTLCLRFDITYTFMCVRLCVWVLRSTTRGNEHERNIYKWFVCTARSRQLGRFI